MNRLLPVAALLLAWLLPIIAEAQPSNFDHFTAGFRLDGAHRSVDCESCHVAGVFPGTPIECSGCHTQGGRVRASAPPTSHPSTTHFCADCHRTTAWLPIARMNHDAILGSCSSCHNNVQSVGKPPQHLLTTLDCGTCHRTLAWTPARFDHADVAAPCMSCHNGTTATGKPPGHLVTTADCGLCHGTNAWLPSSFDHSTVTPGTCSSCHNGVTSTGKSAGHFVTTLECDHCHSRTVWSPLTFKHTSATYPGDHGVSLSCADCHKSNSQQVVWPYPAYAPDCAACHAQDYRPGDHKNATVSTNRNCGACHRITGRSFSK
jgi:cytochrome c7-like protein